MLEFANTKLWGSWSSLIDSLRTGNPPSRMGGEDDFFAALYNTPENLRKFLAAMRVAWMTAHVDRSVVV
jgi:hypothetical protein